MDIVGVLGLTPSMNTAYCQGMSKIIAYYQIVALALLNVVIVLRIHALYGRRRDVFLALAILLVFAYSAAIALQSHYFGQIVYPTVAYTSIPEFQICFATKWQGLWTVWVPSTIFESIIWCLTAYKTWEHWFVNRIPLRAALLGDGILYLTFAVAVRLLCLLMFRFTSSVALMLFGVNLSFSVVTVIGSRMLLFLPSVRNVEQGSRDQDALRDSSADSTISADWAISPDLSFRKPKPDLWLANQGGRSFMEQVYLTTAGLDGVDAPPRPTTLYMDKFTVSKITSP